MSKWQSCLRFVSDTTDSLRCLRYNVFSWNLSNTQYLWQICTMDFQHRCDNYFWQQLCWSEHHVQWWCISCLSLRGFDFSCQYGMGICSRESVDQMFKNSFIIFTCLIQVQRVWFQWKCLLTTVTDCFKLTACLCVTLS